MKKIFTLYFPSGKIKNISRVEDIFTLSNYGENKDNIQYIITENVLQLSIENNLNEDMFPYNFWYIYLLKDVFNGPKGQEIKDTYEDFLLEIVHEKFLDRNYLSVQKTKERKKWEKKFLLIPLEYRLKILMEVHFLMGIYESFNFRLYVQNNGNRISDLNYSHFHSWFGKGALGIYSMIKKLTPELKL